MSDFIASVAGLVLGLVLGQFIRFRRVDTHGRHLLKPELDTRPFHSRIINVALVMMFVISTMTTVWFTWSQRACNAQFQSSLKNNSAIGAQDRALEVRDDALRERRDDALGILVEELLGPVTASPARLHDVLEVYRDVLEVYRDTVRSNDDERDVLNVERRELERQRTENPYPEARC